jgi:hypothetical protein
MGCTNRVISKVMTRSLLNDAFVCQSKLLDVFQMLRDYNIVKQIPNGYILLHLYSIESKQNSELAQGVDTFILSHNVSCFRSIYLGITNAPGHPEDENKVGLSSGLFIASSFAIS